MRKMRGCSNEEFYAITCDGKHDTGKAVGVNVAHSIGAAIVLGLPPNYQILGVTRFYTSKNSLIRYGS